MVTSLENLFGEDTDTQSSGSGFSSLENIFATDETPETQAPQQPIAQPSVPEMLQDLPESTFTPYTPTKEKKKLTLGQTLKGGAKSFFTGIGVGGWGIADQILHLGSRIARQTEDKTIDAAITGLEELGVESKFLKKVKEKDYADFLEQNRLNIKERVSRETEASRESNPLADMFGGKVAEVTGGMIPQITLALTGAPALALSLSESTMNAEQSYDENIERGLSHEEAMKRAIPQFGADLAATYIANKFGLFGKISGNKALFTSNKNLTKKIIASVAETLKDAGIEIGQEVVQTGFQNLATDKPLGQGMSETALLTIIPSLLFGGAANIPTSDINIKEKTAEIINTANQKIANNEPLTEQETIAYTLADGKNPFDDVPEQITEEELKNISEETKILQAQEEFEQVPIETEEEVSIVGAKPEEIKKYISDVENELRNVYTEAGLDEEGFAKADVALAQIGTELEISEAGKRLFVPAKVGGGSDVIALRSTFPEWIPEELRRKELFEKVLGGLDINNFKYPSANRKRQRRLYDAILDELDNRLGIDTKPIRNKINLAYEEKTITTKRKIKTTTDRGASGRKGEPGIEPKTEIKKKEEKPPEKKIKTRGLAKGVEVKAIENKLTEGFSDLPEYETENVKEQSQKAKDLLNEDLDRAIRIALGQELPPQGLLPESVFIAVEEYATLNNDVMLLHQLATQSKLLEEGTVMGQRLRMLAERAPDSPLGAIEIIIKARKKRYERKNKGESADQAIARERRKIAKEAKEKTPKVKKEDWNDFINSLEC